MLPTRCKPQARCKLSSTRCNLGACMYKVHLVNDKVHLYAIKLQFINQIAKCVHNPTLPRCIHSQCAFLKSCMDVSTLCSTHLCTMCTLSMPRCTLLVPRCILSTTMCTLSLTELWCLPKNHYYFNSNKHT
jgi:hypothetical protein